MRIGIYYSNINKERQANLYLNKTLQDFYEKGIYITKIYNFSSCGSVFTMSDNSTIRIFYDSSGDFSFLVKNGRQNIMFVEDIYSQHIKETIIKPLCSLFPYKLYYF